MFQDKVYDKQALGIIGEISKSYHHLANVETGVVADENVCIGCFIQAKGGGATDEQEVIGASGKAVNGRILGVVIKDNYITNCSGNLHIVPKGENVRYLTAGSIFIETETEAKKGQYVFLNNGTGALEFDDKMVKAGSTFTGWIVNRGGKADAGHEVIEITTAQANTIFKQDIIQ